MSDTPMRAWWTMTPTEEENLALHAENQRLYLALEKHHWPDVGSFNQMTARYFVLLESARAVTEAWDLLGKRDPGPISEWKRLMAELKAAVEQVDDAT